MNRVGWLTLALIAGSALNAIPGQAVSAQIRASERGGVFQIVDGTRIDIEFARPDTRGRDNLYGGVVPWGKVWTGANWATTIEASNDITINGHDLPAGKYSVWLEVQREDWTAIIDPQPRRFHLMPPGESADQVRFKVHPEPVSGTRLLTWSFTEVRPTGTTLQMAWGDRRVIFDIGVHPSRPFEVPADLAERYVGNWRLTPQGPLGTTPVSFDIRYENEKLVANWESSPTPLLAELWLLHLGEGMFVAAELDDGELFDIVMDVVFEFTPLEGRADRFELRALGDQLWGTAVRR